MAISSLIPFMHYGLNGSICNEGQAYIVIAKVADCGAVGDEEHCLLRVGGEYAGIECLLGLLVERAADLVEEEDIPAVEQPAGDSDALGLTLTESTTPLTQFGIETVGQVKDEISAGGM